MNEIKKKKKNIVGYILMKLQKSKDKEKISDFQRENIGYHNRIKRLD